MPSSHLALVFNPSVAAADAGTSHRRLDIKGLNQKDYYIYSIEASVRILQSELPAVTPWIGFNLSTQPLGDSTDDSFALWNAGSDKDSGDTFFFAHFSELPSKNPYVKNFQWPYEIRYYDSLFASFTLDNLNQAAAYSTAVRVHLIIHYDLERPFRIQGNSIYQGR